MEGGGAERQLTYLCQGLSRLNWRVHVALYHEGPNIQRLRNSGAIIHTLDSLGHHDPLNVLRLVRLIGKIQPSIVQTWLPMMDSIGGMAAFVSGIPHILSERTAAVAHEQTWKNALRTAIGRRAAAVISNSAAGDEYWKMKLDQTSIDRFIIPNALPFQEIDQAEPACPEVLNIPSNRPIVLYVGRFGPPKNLETLVSALQLVVRTCDAVAVLIGEGNQQQEIEQHINSYSCSDRIFVRAFQAPIWGWMKTASVFVSISHYEGMPNSVMEAMACGCPTVISDIPQHRAMLDNNSAMFVNPDDINQISSAIVQCINEPAAAKSRAASAQAQTMHWSSDEVASRYDETYRCILGPKASRSHCQPSY
jgi:glycosyltransferase involved in cell wall biosynthesis